MQQIDADIISRCKAGDKAAFRTVVQNCQGMVYSLSLKMLADVEEAKAAIQAEQPHGNTILIKGSNGTKLFQLPELL
jgi:UDP-N-acetylmuramyl pentapeptide synthase